MNHSNSRVAIFPELPGRRIIGGWVLLAALVFALTLSRNFPPMPNHPAGSFLAGVTATNLPPAESLDAQIKAAGFESVSSNQVMAAFNDPRRLTRKIVFVDARNETEFKGGRIPGALLFDPYHPEKYFDAVLPVCQAAEKIIVYCHGGDCDDSLTAAGLLRDTGIPAGKISVYPGGMAEWLDLRMPLEADRESGLPFPPPKP